MHLFFIDKFFLGKLTSNTISNFEYNFKFQISLEFVDCLGANEVPNRCGSVCRNKMTSYIKGTVMQITKALINDRLRILKVSWKFPIPTTDNFTVFYPWNLLFSQKVAYLLTVVIVFLFINKTLRLNSLKNRIAMNVKTLVFVICVKAVIYLLLYNSHDCTFNDILHLSILES